MSHWMQILLKSIALLIIVFTITRVMGKRNLVRLTPFQLTGHIVRAVIAALLSAGVITNLVFGFTALGVWVFIPLGLEFLTAKSMLVYDFVYGKETVLIRQGKILEENLQKERMTGEELMGSLRSHNVFSLADVEFAVMESTGEINAFLKAQKKPLTPYDLSIKVAPQSEPQTVILDGNIINEALAVQGLTRQWLDTQLESMGVTLKNVFIGQVDAAGELYLDLFDDAVNLPKPKVRELLYANLEKVQADLTLYADETGDQNAKAMYYKNSARLKIVMDQLKPYLLR